MKRGILVTLVFLTLFLGLDFTSANLPLYLRDNVISCWTLDETGSNTTAVDFGLGQQNNGTIQGATIGIPSAISSLGNAYYVNGTTGVRMPDSASLDITSDFTFVVVFNQSGGAGDNKHIIGKGDPLDDVGWLMYSYVTNGAFAEVEQTGGASTSVLIDNSDINRSLTSMWVASYDAGANVTFYINGSLEGSSSTNIQSSALANDLPFKIGGGSYENSTFNFTGYISEVWIVNTTLNATDVALIYNNSGIETCLTNGSFPPPEQNVTVFQNVNVTNNLTVGNNLTASNGFFTNLGLAISRITKGWFTDLDVSGTANLTGATYLKNASCSAGQVLTTNSNGLVSCTTLTVIKSGKIVNVTETFPVVVTFATSFTSDPHCTASVDLSGPGSASEGSAFFSGSPNTTAMRIGWEDKSGGANKIENILWVCTNAGNP